MNNREECEKSKLKSMQTYVFTDADRYRQYLLLAHLLMLDLCQSPALIL